MTFNINKDSRIFVYGGGALGRSYYRQLQEGGYKVKGIIDRNADIIKKKDGLPYISTNDYADFHKKDDVIIICVHNALWHIEIVNSLRPLGVENILFIPLGKEFGRIKSNKMMKAYNHFVNREYEALNNIPTLASLSDFNLDVKKAVLNETAETVVCWIDITTLYTSESVGYATQRHAPKELENFVDTPMPGMLPYVNLFRMLAGQSEGEGDSFVRLCKRFQNSIDEYSDEEFVNDRFDLYNELNTQLNFGIDRFIDAAPDCVWNEKGFFNLLDGMSRTTFLYSKGFQYVPVKVQKKEFEYWANQKEVSELSKSLPSMTNWEIEHPAFLEYPVKTPGVKRLVMTAIEEHFSSKKWRGDIISDYTATDGCLARYFARQGATVIRYVDEKDLYFEHGLNKLFRQEKSIKIRKEMTKKYDTSLLMLSVTSSNISLIKKIISQYESAKLLCLYHNMKDDAIDDFEKGLKVVSSWKKDNKGRETVKICLYR